MMDHTQAIRKTLVVGVDVRHSKPGDPLHPQVAFEDKFEEVWSVFLKTQSGMLPAASSLHLFGSEEDADRFVARFPIGSEVDPKIQWLGMEQRRLNFVRVSLDRKHVPTAQNAGDWDSPLAFNVLDEAGLTNFRDGVSKTVLDSLGRQRTGQLKVLFEDNWKIAAVFEYCWLNLPASSPAYVAALYQFQYYINEDDFAAGYLWRDLETLVHGVEAAALGSIEMRKKAGVAGSEKSALARESRRSALMVEMEAVTQRNPDFAKLGADTVARLAVDSCAEKAPLLWKQGKGQVSEYLGEIRRGEAGLDLKQRFETLFGAKPLRRLRQN